MQTRIAYSCVVDNTPKLLWEGAVFRRALTEVAGVAPDDIVIHVTDRVPAAARDALAGPCRVAVVQRFDKRYGFANKIAQLAHDWSDVDAVAFLDADMIVLAPFDPGDVADTVAGVPVFAAVPDEVALRAIYRRYGPERAGDWLHLTGLHGEPYVTHRNNLNGGLYLVPADLIAPFGAAWAAEVARLLADPAALEGAHPSGADQLGAGTALARIGLRAHHLSMTRNCPPPRARAWPARIIHDLGKFVVEDRDRAGHLHLAPDVAGHPKRLALSAIIDEVNETSVGRPFAACRAFRYALRADEFGAAERYIDELEEGPFPFPAAAATMRMHLAAYQRMARGGGGSPPAREERVRAPA